MGKPTGFMEYDRQERSYQPTGDRISHYNEFVIDMSSSDLKQQAARCMDCGIPFCHSGCPVNNMIPDWNDLVYKGAWKEAISNLHSTNNFPEFTGRICPAPCETSCTLNIEDTPVSIVHTPEDRYPNGLSVCQGPFLVDWKNSDLKVPGEGYVVVHNVGVGGNPVL